LLRKEALELAEMKHIFSRTLIFTILCHRACQFATRGPPKRFDWPEIPLGWRSVRVA
jgi:hypothetical protein